MPATNAAAQPAELTEGDRLRITEWLDKEGPLPFQVIAKPRSKKRKRGDDSGQYQDGLWEERLSTNYKIHPHDKWQCLKSYKKFTVAGESGPESIARDQCVLVKAPDSGDGVHIDIDPAAQWKAKVLEVRALNPEHVYLRVAWLNRPEDLPGGREPHHGRNELIPTNQMDIIDAMTVNGAIEVAHWDQYDDESPSFQDQYYWRQTMDFLESGNKKFSNIRSICIDRQPINPDKVIIQCVKCQEWHHADCLAADALTASLRGRRKKSKSKKGKQSLTKNAASRGYAIDDKTGVFAELFMKDEPADEPDISPAAASEIVITEPDGTKISQHPRCLFCSEPITDD